MIFDTHCHLNHPDLYARIDEVISSAKANGVTRFLVVGYDKESSLLAVKIAHQYPECYAAIGYHPTEIENLSNEDYLEVMNYLTDDRVVCLGEIGLDYYWVKDEEKQDIQKQWFIKQINEANRNQLPISIHCRDAIEDCLKILKEHTPKYGGVMHCFSGSVETMRELVKLGLYISFGGPVTFKNARIQKEVATEIDLGDLLVETDSPYLAPHPLRGSQNEPKNTKLVVEEIARLKQEDVSVVEIETWINANRLFGIKE